ncbi:hypothetical protein [Nocardioides aurantiacus]|uniref:Uncharacterized protein n=1 Tax=Nocardioides aurantiacus TaxID=86796 RepID=A0A3N2CY68_9ACTN|nr:hypothetical protein [Nocardioides aurantiacus]ROR92154.1 hypothetical protein EDD33_3038 [Nocardioides aurantiacus]
MSQPSPQVPPPPYDALPARPRPRRGWFAVGGVLLALAAVVFVVGLVTTVGRGTDTDVVALVPGPGQPISAGVPVGEERMLFVPAGEPAPRCRVVDGRGRELPLRPTTVATTVTTMGTTWTGVSTFTSPTTAEVRVGCEAPVEQLRIGSPLGAGFAIGLVLTILGPLALGGVGLVVLVVTTVLWSTRPPRSPRGHHGGPGGAPAPPSSPSRGW